VPLQPASSTAARAARRCSHGCSSYSRTRGEEPPRLITPARAGLAGLFLTVLIEAGFLLTFSLLHHYRFPGFQPPRLKGGSNLPNSGVLASSPAAGKTQAGTDEQLPAPLEGGGWPESLVSQQWHHRLGPHHPMQWKPSQDSLGRETCHPLLAQMQGHGSMAGLQGQLWVLVPPETPLLLGVPQP